MSGDEDRLYAELRPRAFAIAYRMLGSVTAAEDIVQEALLRLHRSRAAGETIDSPRAYVATIATRLAIDELRSARARRETYVGDWLPEPLIGPATDDPAVAAQEADSLSLAFLLLLESLSPEQRAVLLLRDVFDYGYAEIGLIIGKEPDNVRQLAARARRHLDGRRPRFETSRARREELARRFFGAARDGDLPGLEALLAEDVVLRGDGGGKVPALARALHGRGRVARTLAAWARQGARMPGAGFSTVTVNGQPGAVLLDGDRRLIGVMALEISGGEVHGVSSIVNPEKLRHIGRTANLGALLRQERPEASSDTDR